MQKIYKKLSFVTEVDFGAGGGGSLKTGNGSIVEVLPGFIFNYNKNFAIEAMYGNIYSNATLKTGVIDIALIYKFFKPKLYKQWVKYCSHF